MISENEINYLEILYRKQEGNKGKTREHWVIATSW